MTDVSATPGLDLHGLDEWLRTEHPELRGDQVRATLLTGGRSNLTYRIDGPVRPLIVRRPPLGGTLATAHDMAREHKVMSALRPTAVPVPEMIALVDDTAGRVTGSVFLVEEFVDGAVLSNREDNAPFSATQRRGLAMELTGTLAALHAVDPEGVGLGDFGRPAGFTGRQVQRWRRQWDAVRSGPHPRFDGLADELAATAPETSRPAIVHGDYRLDNVIVETSSDGPRIAAVIDWEMATLGDPLVDLGMLGLYWSVGALPGAQSLVPTAVDEGYPSFDELVDAYAAASHSPIPQLGWYRAFADFKLAIIAADVDARYRAGHMADEGAGSVAALIDALVDDGLRRVRAEGH